MIPYAQWNFEKKWVTKVKLEHRTGVDLILNFPKKVSEGKAVQRVCQYLSKKATVNWLNEYKINSIYFSKKQHIKPGQLRGKAFKGLSVSNGNLSRYKNTLYIGFDS